MGLHTRREPRLISVLQTGCPTTNLILTRASGDEGSMKEPISAIGLVTPEDSAQEKGIRLPTVPVAEFAHRPLVPGWAGISVQQLQKDTGLFSKAGG
jgi:hypothetical protein